MRLIDADELVKDIEDYQKSMVFHSYGERMHFDEMIDFAVDHLEEAPTINAVPVVQYKDTNTTVLNVKSIEDWQDRIILDEGEESRSCAVYYADSDDMVRVVRCKNCEHWGATDYAIAETERVKCCAYANYMIDANGYCMYGEIKETTK